jgi:response regulator of citrate/malate metabolism
MKNQLTHLQVSEEICIIDDSPVPMAITKRICQRILPQVPILTFADVDSAVTYLMNTIQKKRTIFLDLYMPEKNGWNFLELYRPSLFEVVYILSSSDSQDDIDKAKEHPDVTDYLLKPLTLDKAKQL